MLHATFVPIFSEKSIVAILESCANEVLQFNSTKLRTNQVDFPDFKFSFL